MSEPTVDQVVAEIVRTLRQAHAKKIRGLVVLRCTGSREVDHARETLIRAQAVFKWKSLPTAQLDPPDLIGYVLHHTKPEGPAFLAYGLPKGRDGHVLKRFVELITVAGRKYVMAPYLMVMILTLDEIKDLSKHAPQFWKGRDRYLGWPVKSAESSFVPARLGKGLPARRKSAMAVRGGGVSKAGAGVGKIEGGVEQAAGIEGFYGNPLMDGADLSDADYTLAPWAGAPFKEGDDIPQYIADAAPPAGRRWGRTLAPDDAEGSALIDKCRVLLDQRHTEFARQGLAKAAKRFRAANNGPATAECYVLLGRASELRFDHTVALEWYEQAIQVFEQISDDAGVSDCSNMIGYLRFMHGDLDGAFTFFDKALRRDEEVEDLLRTASGYRRIGIILEHRSELNQANALYERAGEIERKNEDRYAYSRSLHHQARVAQMKDRFRDALELLQMSLKIKEELEDEAGMATGLHELGNIEFKQRNLEEALEAYEQALEFEEKIVDVPGIAVTCAQIGLVRREMFHFADAVRSFAIARTLFQRLQSPYVQALESATESAREMVDDDVYNAMVDEAMEYVDAMLEPT